MPLDPQYRPILEQMSFDALEMEKLDPAELRAMMKAMPGPLHEPQPVASIENREIDGPAGPLSVRVFRPPPAGGDGPPPLVVFFHGGGFVIGDLDTHDFTCRSISSLSGSVVVSVDYRLAPEARFPAAPDDCYAATLWAAAHAAELDADPRRVAVAGDSAGGNLAAVVALMARDRGGPQLVHQLLLYPVINHDFDTISYREFASGYLLTRDAMRWFWGHYLTRPEQGDSPLASPIRADSHVGLPPATIVTAEFDPLRDEGEAYGRRLAEAGVPVEVVREDGQIHGFFGFEGMVASADRAIAATCARLRAALAG